MIGPLANEAGWTRLLVVPKGIVCGFATRLAVIRGRALRFRRLVERRGRVSARVAVARDLELKEALLVLVHGNDGGGIGGVFKANVNVKPEDRREIVHKLALVSEKAKMGCPHIRKNALCHKCYRLKANTIYAHKSP